MENDLPQKLIKNVFFLNKCADDMTFYDFRLNLYEDHFNWMSQSLVDLHRFERHEDNCPICRTSESDLNDIFDDNFGD